MTREPTGETWDDEFETVLRRSLRWLRDTDELRADASLPALGLDSLLSLELLFSLEDTYGISFPDDLLDNTLFATPHSLWSAVRALRMPGSPTSGEEVTANRD